MCWTHHSSIAQYHAPVMTLASSLLWVFRDWVRRQHVPASRPTCWNTWSDTEGRLGGKSRGRQLSTLSTVFAPCFQAANNHSLPQIRVIRLLYTSGDFSKSLPLSWIPSGRSKWATQYRHWNQTDPGKIDTVSTAKQGENPPLSDTNSYYEGDMGSPWDEIQMKWISMW